MKPGRINFFILACLLLLAAVCFLLQKENIQTRFEFFRFPHPKGLLCAEQTVEQYDTDSDTALISSSPAIQEEPSIKHTTQTNQTTTINKWLVLPDTNIAYFNPLFRMMHPHNKLRIMHYGDSQLEGDRITSVLRERLQSIFGGGGVGLIPALQSIPTYTLSQTISPADVKRYLVYGPKDMRLLEGTRYGMMGQITRLEETTVIHVSARNARNFPNASRFSQINIYASDSIRVQIITKTDTLQASKQQWGEYFYCYSTQFGSTSKADIVISGTADIYGIAIDDNHGICVDNIPMRGCSGTVFTNIENSSIAPFLGKENVGLIILQFGGNSMPYLKDGNDISNYITALSRQINKFQNIAPQALILFIGPSDMATNIDGQMTTYPMLPIVVDSLKAMAQSKKIAYWDLYGAMGGYGSMTNWETKGLAGTDYIHFTPEGARKVGNMLSDTFEQLYRMYEDQQKPREICDTMQNISTESITPNHSITEQSKAEH